MTTQAKQLAGERTQEHTPGPWEIDDDHQHDWPGLAIWSEDNVIAHVVDDHHNNKEANAKLIAAAPETLAQRDELLAALREVHEWGVYNFAPTITEIARAAIARAEGRAL